MRDIRTLLSVGRLASLLAVAVPAALRAQPAPDARIRAVMERPEFAHATWGMEFYDLDAKRVLASVNGDRLFVPGSSTRSASSSASAARRMATWSRSRARPWPQFSSAKAPTMPARITRNSAT